MGPHHGDQTGGDSRQRPGRSLQVPRRTARCPGPVSSLRSYFLRFEDRRGVSSSSLRPHPCPRFPVPPPLPFPGGSFSRTPLFFRHSLPSFSLPNPCVFAESRNSLFLHSQLFLLSLERSRRSEAWVVSVFWLPLPPRCMFGLADFYRLPSPSSLRLGPQVCRKTSILESTSPELRGEQLSNLPFSPWHFSVNCYKELLSCSSRNLSEGGSKV